MEFAHHRQPPTEWVEWLDSWVAAMRFEENTAATIENWWYKVSHLALTVGTPPWMVTQADVMRWISRGTGNASKRSDRSAVVSFFRWALQAGRRSDDPTAAIGKIKRDHRKQLPAPDSAMLKGLASPDPRVRLIIRLIADAGLRRTEVSVAHKRDVVDDLLGSSLLVHGKGNKDRVVPLSRELQDMIRPLPYDYLLPGNAHGHICGDTVYHLVKETTGWTTHSFRRKFATDVWRATGDVLKVQELLGHESLATTQRYIFSGTDDLRGAVTSLIDYRSHTERRSADRALQQA